MTTDFLFIFRQPFIRDSIFNQITVIHGVLQAAALPYIHLNPCKGRELKTKSLYQVASYRCYDIFKELFDEFNKINEIELQQNPSYDSTKTIIFSKAVQVKDYKTTKLLCLHDWHIGSLSDIGVVGNFCSHGWKDLFELFLSKLQNNKIQRLQIWSCGEAYLIQNNDVEFLDYYLKSAKKDLVSIEISRDSLIRPASNGHLEVVQYLLDHPSFRDGLVDKIQNIFEEACKCNRFIRKASGNSDNVNVLEYLLEKQSAEITHTAFRNALQSGNERVISYILDIMDCKDIQMKEDTKIVIETGIKDIQLLSRLFKHPLVDCSQLLKVSLQSDFPIQIINYLIDDQNLEVDHRIFEQAIRYSSSIDIVLAIESKFQLNSKRAEYYNPTIILDAAIQSNRPTIANYVFERYFNDYDPRVILLRSHDYPLFFENAPLEMVKLLHKYNILNPSEHLKPTDVIKEAMRFHKLDNLKYLIENVYDKGESPAINKNIQKIPFAVRRKNSRFSREYPIRDDIACYLYESGWVDLGYSPLSGVADLGLLGLSKIIIENQLDKCSEMESSAALGSGNVELVKYLYEKNLLVLHERGGQYISALVSSGNIPMLQFILDHYPSQDLNVKQQFLKTLLRVSIMNQNVSCYRFIKELIY